MIEIKCEDKEFFVDENSWCKIVYSLKDYFYVNLFLLVIYGFLFYYVLI